MLIATASTVLLVVAFGCGSNDDGSETPSAPLTKAQFIKQADQICKERLKEKDEAVKATLKKASPEEIANPSQEKLKELGESTIPPFTQLTSEISELPAPAQDQAEVEKITSGLEAGLKRAEADPGKLAEVDPYADAAAAAKEYGLRYCNF